MTKEGIIFAISKEEESSLMVKSNWEYINQFKYLIGKESERLYKIDNHIYCVVSGMAADCNVLLDMSR